MNFDSVYSEYCSNGGRLGDKMYSFIKAALKEFRYTPSGSKAPTEDDLLQDVVETLMKNDHQKLRRVMSTSAVGMHHNLPITPEAVLSRQIKTIIKHCLYDDRLRERDSLHNLSERIIFALKQDPYRYKDVRASGRSWLVSPQAVKNNFPSDFEIEASFRALVLDCSSIPKLLFNSSRGSPIYKGPEFDLLCETLNELLPDWGSGSVREEERKNETTEGLDDMALQIATSAVDRLDSRSKSVVSAYFSMENPNWVQVAIATESTEYPVDRKEAKQIIDSFGQSLLELAVDYPFDTEAIIGKAVDCLSSVLLSGEAS